MADALKAEGNKAFQEKRFEDSIDKFTQAIALDSKNHVLYSNRSGSYQSLKDYDNALTDADKTIEIKPEWPKGYTRKAAALHGKGDLVGAHDAYEEALKLDPNNAQAKSGLQSVSRAMEREAGGAGNPAMGIGQLFADPQIIPKIANNPRTAHLLGDADFMQKLQRLRQNPASADQSVLMDQRFMAVLGLLLGADIQTGGPGSDAERRTREAQAGQDEDEEMPDLKPASSSSSRKPAPKAATPEPESEEDDDTKAQKEAKAKADGEKKLGTDAYKKRQFDVAAEHYTKAWELHKDITYLTNLGAAYFEKGDYEKCIEACKEAVTHGRETYADFKLIAKAFGRIGTAYEKLGDLSSAVTNYQSSLTEHRTPEILAKLRAAEKNKITAEKNSYIDPAKAEEARELGNAKFKEADWPAAVEAYSEMIKRAPDDPRGFSNRAACFIKLLSFPSAVQDCDEAIKRDAKFIRAYLRKAQAYFAMREYSKCLDACTEASEHDEGGKNAREIEQQQYKAMEAQYAAREGETEEQTMERIQKDPEIGRILGDPVMQTILQQAKNDPAALQEHMRNPQIKASIQKLVSAGVIRMGR